LASTVVFLTSFGCLGAVALAGNARAEVVARGAANGVLAVSPKGVPSVAFVRGTEVLVSTRVASGRWWTLRAGRVSAGSTVKAFDVGKSGPAIAVGSSDIRTLVVFRARGTRWQRIPIAHTPPQIGLGWPGLAFDRDGLPVVAYTRWNSTNLNTQLLLVRIKPRGALLTQRVTAEGFPQSEVPPPAAPVVVGGKVHVVETYGFRTVVGAFEWYPNGKTWTGIGLDVTRGEVPLGPLFAGRRAGRVYATWTQTMEAIEGAVPVTLAQRAQTAKATFLLDRALTTALALSASGAEVAANQWVSANELGLDGNANIWDATIISGRRSVSLDGWIGGLAVTPRGGRDLLLERDGNLEWFHSPERLATRVNVGVSSGSSRVSLSGYIEGARSGKVTIYREHPGGHRQVAGTAEVSNGSFSFVDPTSTRPLLYRVVYRDPKTAIPYAALTRPVLY